MVETTPECAQRAARLHLMLTLPSEFVCKIVPVFLSSMLMMEAISVFRFVKLQILALWETELVLHLAPTFLLLYTLLTVLIECVYFNVSMQ